MKRVKKQLDIIIDKLTYLRDRLESIDVEDRKQAKECRRLLRALKKHLTILIVQ